MVAILGRVHRYRRTVDPEVLARLSDHLDHLVEGYDQMDHSVLVPVLVEQRAWVDSLLDDCPDLRRRRELLHIAGGTAGLLGYIAVGHGAFAVARAYLAEGLCLAELATDANLRAWVRGMQSIAEYYTGNYRDALALAEDGLTSVGPTPQAARLLANGVARAAGKLCDERRVRSAVDEVLDLVHGNGTTPAGFPSSVTFGSYSAAQVASNAATAFLALGQAELVEAYGQRALPDVEKSGSPWSRSLVLIDLATAVATSGTGDLDRASALLLEALSYSAGRPIIAVTVRAKEFLRTAADRWGQTRQITAVGSAVAALEHNRG